MIESIIDDSHSGMSDVAFRPAPPNGGLSCCCCQCLESCEYFMQHVQLLAQTFVMSTPSDNSEVLDVAKMASTMLVSFM